MNARDCAKDLIRYYVQRGDDMQWICSGHMRHMGLDYDAQIGSWVTKNGRRKEMPQETLVVTEIAGVAVFVTFQVGQIWKEIQDELKNKNKPKQLALF